jgi:hypothetical protein
MPKDNLVNLLWTGGWDSTFRLLELLHVRKRIVQPYYILDSERRSMCIEIARREQIIRLLIEKNPTTNDLLLPTIFKAKTDIKVNNELAQNYKNILTRQRLGKQHEWLAFFADELKIKDLEICNHINDPAVTIIKPFSTRIENNDGFFYYLVRSDIADQDVYHLFKYFRFPLLMMNKREIEQKSKAYDFIDIMEYTWFCHNPLGRLPMNARPCGTCNTCIYTINTQGMQRIPYISRIRYYFMRFLRPTRFKTLTQRQGIS